MNKEYYYDIIFGAKDHIHRLNAYFLEQYSKATNEDIAPNIFFTTLRDVLDDCIYNTDNIDELVGANNKNLMFKDVKFKKYQLEMLILEHPDLLRHLENKVDEIQNICFEQLSQGQFEEYQEQKGKAFFAKFFAPIDNKDIDKRGKGESYIEFGLLDRLNDIEANAKGIIDKFPQNKIKCAAWVELLMDKGYFYKEHKSTNRKSCIAFAKARYNVDIETQMATAQKGKRITHKTQLAHYFK